MTRRKSTSTAARYLRGVMITLALLLPAASLAVLGTLWLWQNNALLIWGIGATSVALLIYGGELWLVRRREGELEYLANGSDTDAQADPAKQARPLREQQALAAVEQLAQDVEPATLNNRDAILELGRKTIEAVAHNMHPDAKNPLWQFTVPEALKLVERVSSQLNRFVTDSIPLGDRLTVGQVLAVYRWRSLATVAEKAYDLWRILRFVNPAAAIAGELREKVSSQLLDSMRAEFTRRLARAYVREVGAAAIDLYSGRLRPDLIGGDDGAAVPEAIAPEAFAPLHVLLVGQSGVGKSSLINALTDEVQAAVDVVPAGGTSATHVLSKDDAPVTHLIDSPGLDSSSERAAEIVGKAEASDAIIWVVSAARPDRSADVSALKLLRSTFAEKVDRRPPPILFLLSNVDRLRPFNEWQPPYDITDTSQAKSRSINDAIVAVAEDLEAPVENIIPIAMPEGAPAYNIDLVWARLINMFDDARNVQLLRLLSQGRRRPLTKTLWRQAIGAGRVIRQTLLEKG